ncbi:hypothetical protein L204_101213 [Cryptococcus depauperatus]|nr:hypothetical protein L204_00857 [Cryptococcus depauperatus CBS 7855]
MPRGKGLTKHQYSQGLAYVAQKPSFLQHFGQLPTQPQSTSTTALHGARNREGREGREPLPSRPDEGQWAKGSDNEDGLSEEEDELAGLIRGVAGDDTPQVVVLKEGRHLSLDEIQREKQKASGSKTPPLEDTDAKKQVFREAQKKDKGHPPIKRNAKINSNKRKLVGSDLDTQKGTAVENQPKDRKKKKAKKGLLSFDEEEG